MLRPKKKISKKELKQDTLISTYMTLTGWYEQYKRPISITITAVVVVVIGLVVYLKNLGETNERAFTQLAAIQPFFDNGQYQQAVDGIPERNIAGLKTIVENSSGTHAGNLARFYLAGAYFQLGKFSDALNQFNDASMSENLLESSRLAGIAACHEALGDHRKAGEYFERAASKDPTEGSAAEHLDNAARNYAQAGEKDRALDILRKLKKNYPTTSSGRDADRYISQFSM